MIGSTLAHYQITSHLGSGGMGEVYQAVDSRLGRNVAIKLLPVAFAQDAERTARFEREARVLASLNHPHIASIHGLEVADGRHFLVMELVDGETLADRIARGAMPVNEALDFAVQIAEALDAAHEKGIVHRDLKPANVKITSGGAVKVLDFGLAKALEGPAQAGLYGPGHVSMSPTISLAATSAGVILGTASYMSPEQAKGLNTDKRTDIFAFGSVLYEMLTGRQLFPGETVSEVLARVIEREPDWARLPADLHPRVTELVQRCLRKDPKQRWRDIGDVGIEIEAARAAPPPTTQPAQLPPANRSARLAWSSAALAAVALAGALVGRLQPAATPPQLRVDIVTPPTSDPMSFALSPDGRRIVFVATADGQPHLWLRPLDGVSAQVMSGTEGASQPFWSPDSQSIAFFGGGKLKRIDIGGGLPQTIGNAANPRGGAWSPTGVILFSPSSTAPLFRIPASGGEAVPVTQLNEQQVSHRFPQFVSDTQFLFYSQAQPEAAGVYLGSLDGPGATRLTAADAAGYFLSPGWLLYIRQGTLLARRLDISRKELTGDPLTVADPVAFDPNFNVAAFSVSATGPVAYRTGVATRRQLTWFDRSGKVLGGLGQPDENALLSPDVSHDGRRIAVDRTVQNNTDLWLLDGTRMTRFTFDAQMDHGAVWSPDGSRIAFDGVRKAGVHDLYVKASSGAGNEVPLFESPESKGVFDWSPDGRFILFSTNAPETSFDLWVLPTEGDRKPQLFVNTSFEERQGQFSPDGRWVAYQSNESGRFEIYVRPFPKSDGQWQVSAGGGVSPRWRRDGKELYYIAPDGRLMATPVTTGRDLFEPGTPVALFPTRIVGGGVSLFAAQYDVAPDGRFLINVSQEEAVTSPITLLLNWPPREK